MSRSSPGRVQLLFATRPTPWPTALAPGQLRSAMSVHGSEVMWGENWQRGRSATRWRWAYRWERSGEADCVTPVLVTHSRSKLVGYTQPRELQTRLSQRVAPRFFAHGALRLAGVAVLSVALESCVAIAEDYTVVDAHVVRLPLDGRHR
mgnify:CR=1 FL=1